MKNIKWQHEDTGNVVEFPKGKNPGRRWFKVEEYKKPRINFHTLAIAMRQPLSVVEDFFTSGNRKK